MKRYTFTLEETQEIKAARKKNRDKNVEKRLAALEMRAEGKQNKEIREIAAAGQFDRLAAAAVSYTHLDVYKRQGLQHVDGCSISVDLTVKCADVTGGHGKR